MTRQRPSNYPNEGDAIIKKTIATIASTRQTERKKKLSLCLLASLYTVIKYDDYDEDRLTGALRYLRLYRYPCRMIQFPVEKVLSKEGFTPILLRDGRKAEGIKKNDLVRRY